MAFRTQAHIVGQCRTGKLRYKDAYMAEVALVHAMYTNRIRNKKKRHETRIYVCPLCRGWHLTSQEMETELCHS